METFYAINISSTPIGEEFNQVSNSVKGINKSTRSLKLVASSIQGDLVLVNRVLDFIESLPDEEKASVVIHGDADRLLISGPPTLIKILQRSKLISAEPVSTGQAPMSALA
jgi:hypothetical protein